MTKVHVIFDHPSYVSKICSKFHIQIMSNKTVKEYQIAIPLDLKVAINGLIEDISLDRDGLSSTKIILLPEK